jgi:ribose 5-phosphate isomerase B
VARIAIASDHAAFGLKDSLAGWLREQGHAVQDLGTHGPIASTIPIMAIGSPARSRTARPNSAWRCADRASASRSRSIATRLPLRPGLRTAVGAALARQHNDANVIALGARLIGEDMAKACVTAFLETEFEGGRHQRRVDKLSHPNIVERRPYEHQARLLRRSS